jgi:uncharacterized protein (UPF0548 family)
MFFLREPSPTVVRDSLAEQSRLDLTYAPAGATASAPPAGFVVDHTRVRLGEGEKVFQAAVAGLQRWEQFQLGWAEAAPRDIPIRPGEAVAVVAHVYGVWWLNACRIVYCVDDEAPTRRFGFAYGTLPGHAERGEERFLVEWDRSTSTVWYDILAFSRPNLWITRLAYPLVRRTQRRFARGSAAAMLRCVQ